MGFLDFFKASENAKLKKEVERLKSLLTPDNYKIGDLQALIRNLEDEKIKLENKIKELNATISILNDNLSKKKEQLVIFDEEILVQEFGLYTPMYKFATSDEYKDKLNEIREKQKQLVKNHEATCCSTNWTVNGSAAKGRKMTNDNIKQIIRTFNIECENAIDKVKFSNIESTKKRINKSFESLNRINKTNAISIKNEYLNLKLEELHLAYEYVIKKEQEKEEQKRIKEELREQARQKQELEEARKNINKDLQHNTNALETIKIQLNNDNLTIEQSKALLEKKSELENEIEKLNDNLSDIDYRQDNQKAGYVYVISNIGAFGKNIYKIGMTRRLNPEDRVYELGNASVPFNFDTHAMIFSEDAPALENALHKAFENRKVNMVNQRREFFNVKLDEIEKVVKANFDKTVEFKRIPDAEQYRETIRIKQELELKTNKNVNQIQ